MRLTETNNADRLIERYGDEIVYCPQMKAWYIWDGRRWREDDHNGIYQYAINVAKSYTHDAIALSHDDASRPRLIRWSCASESLRSITATINIARANLVICRPIEGFDRNPMLLNVENGTVDLATGKLHPFDHTDYMTKIAPVTYVKGKRSHVWEQFLADVLPDPDTRAFVQAAIGYSLTANMGEEKMFILHGSGGNGKTTFVNTILSLLGVYGSQASSHTLMRKRDSGPRDDLFVLMGKRFVAATETGESHHLDENLIKQMTGGNKVSINPKYRSQMEFFPTWKLWLDTNYEPIITGTDTAIWRRLIKIPFYVNITNANCNTDLKHYLMTDLDERSGILNWALSGVKLWHRRKLQSPHEVTESIKQYRADQDLTGQFLAEVCHLCHLVTTPKDVLYDEYLLYTKRLNEPPKAKSAFGHDLIQRGIREERNKHNRYWVGVSIDKHVSLLPCDAV